MSDSALSTRSFQRVLVTGAAGFIGSSLVDRLLAEGCEVVGLDNFDPYYDPALKRRNVEQACQNSRFQLHEGDLLDRDLLASLFQGKPFDVVVHLAAKAGVRPSLVDPEGYIRTNVAGTLRLMDAMRQASGGGELPRFVAASSSSVYGAQSVAPFAEDGETSRAVSPYAASKKAMEVMAHTYHHLYRLPVTLLRFFTVYGPRQRPEMAIARFLQLASQGKPIPMFGDGASARDYTYIADIVDGIHRAMGACQSFHIYNLGNSAPVRLDALIAAVGEACGRPAQVQRLPDQPGDVPLTCADVSRAQRELGYAPQTTLVQGLKNYLSWSQTVKIST